MKGSTSTWAVPNKQRLQAHACPPDQSAPDQAAPVLQCRGSRTRAWSQNLGHDRVMTTLTSYGNVAPHRQAELIRGMGAAKGAVGQLVGSVDSALVVKVLAALQNMPH